MDIAHDEYYNKYAEYVDNDSAYEFMQRRQAQIADEAFKAAQQKEEELRREKARKQGEKVISDAGKSVAGTAGREVGNALGNAVGGKFGKRIGGNLGATLGRGLFATLFSKKK
jgi:outer membrane lipoprotein SlyB